MTGDVHLTDLIRTMMESRRFFVVLNGKKRRWRRQRNGLPQRSGVQGIDTQTQLYHPLLFSCRIRLPCVGKDYTRAQAERGPTRLQPNHPGLPQTNKLVQCTPAGRYHPLSHKED